MKNIGWWGAARNDKKQKQATSVPPANEQPRQPAEKSRSKVKKQTTPNSQLASPSQLVLALLLASIPLVLAKRVEKNLLSKW